MTTDDLIAYYVDLLIMQYANQPHARATVEAYVRQAVADQIVAQVRDGFNFAVTPIGLQTDSAAGVQLDVVAAYRGAQRLVFGLNLNRLYFVMPLYGDMEADTAPGFAVYGQDPILDLWLTYTDAQQPIYALTDDEIYRLTQLRAQVQNQLLSVENVDTILETFFGNNAGLFEDGHMAITYIDLISDPDTLFGIAASTQSLPRPAGVKLTVLRSETLNEFFGFQEYGHAINPDFVGFGLYGSPQTGSFVRYA